VIPKLAELIREGGAPDPRPEELADILWLASVITVSDDHTNAGTATVPAPGPDPTQSPDGDNQEPATPPDADAGRSRDGNAGPEQRAPQPTDDVSSSGPGHTVRGGLHSPARFGRPGTQTAALVRGPGEPGLTNTLDLMRALRALNRHVPSDTEFDLDEDATVARRLDERMLLPALRPRPSRWLRLAFVQADSPSMALWRSEIHELHQAMVRLGAFRDVRRWRFTERPDSDGTTVEVRRHTATAAQGPALRSRDIVDPTGRQLILVLTDTVGPMWHTGAAQRLLAEWARTSPVAILHLLPSGLWSRGGATPLPAMIQAPRPGAPNARWQTFTGPSRRRSARPGRTVIPVLTLEAEDLRPWAGLTAGNGRWARTAALVIEADHSRLAGGQRRDIATVQLDREPDPVVTDPDPQELIRRFRFSSSGSAWRLAGLLSAVEPITLPIARLVQRAMVPGSSRGDLAEVFLGNLLRREAPAPSEEAEPADQAVFDFVPGVREAILTGQYRRDTRQVRDLVHDEVSAYLERRRDRLGGDQTALTGVSGTGPALAEGLPFASLSAAGMRRLGERPEEVRYGVGQWLPDGPRPSVDDLLVMVAAARAAANAEPPGSRRYGELMSALGAALVLLADQTGDIVDLVDGIEAYLDCVPSGASADRQPWTWHFALGDALLRLARRSGDLGAMVDAAAAFRHAAQANPPESSMRWEILWALNLTESLLSGHEPGDAVSAARRALKDIPFDDPTAVERMYDLGSVLAEASPPDRDSASIYLHAVISDDNVPRAVRSNACRRLAPLVGPPAHALSLIEDAIGLLQLPSPPPHSALPVARLVGEAVAAALDAGRPERAVELLEMLRGAVLPNPPQQAADFGDLIRRVNKAGLGPIVLLNTAPTRCDALIIGGGSSSVTVVPLPALTEAGLCSRAEMLAQVFARRSSGSDPSDFLVRPESTLSGILTWLWISVAQPVLDSLGWQQRRASDGQGSLIWWSPFGPLARLPIHASSEFGLASLGTGVMHRTVSSYTPTIRSLLDAAERRSDPEEHRFGMRVFPIPDEPISRIDIHDLERCEVALFPHGNSSDLLQPTLSQVVAPGRGARSLTIGDIVEARLSAGLALLVGGDSLPSSPVRVEETIPVTGALHLAGFRQVIGALWPVPDWAATMLADRLSPRLDSSIGGVAMGKSARALHKTLIEMQREYSETPLIWAAYTHTGV